MPPFQEFIVALLRSLKTSQMYGAKHPRHMEFMQALAACYEDFLAGKRQAQVAARNGRMFLDKSPEDDGNMHVRSLARILEERSIHALTLYPGVSLEELQSLLQVLSQKPGELREVGGARKLLESLGVTHIRILATRLEEVTEGGEVVAAMLQSVAELAVQRRSGSTGPTPGGIDAGAAQGQTEDRTLPMNVPTRSVMAQIQSAQTERSTPTLVDQLRTFLLAVAGLGGESDLSGLGDFMEQLGLDRQGSQPNTQGILSQAVSSLPAASRLGVFKAASQLRGGQLRATFARLVGSVGASTLAQAYLESGISQEELGSYSPALRSMAPAPERWNDQLLKALSQGGLSQEQLRDLMEILSWESLPPEVRFRKLLEKQKIFEIPTDKVLAFLRELLEGGRLPEFMRLMRHYGTGLASPAVARRTQVAVGFISIAGWVDIPGMPVGLIQELEQLLAQAWGREKDPAVHEPISRAVEHLLWHWVALGDPRRMVLLLGELHDVASELAPPSPWKDRATRDLLTRLASPERIDSVLERVFSQGRQEAMPYLELVGPLATGHLLDRLSQEPDRTRRSRIMELLKACGSVSEGPLLDALEAPDWFVVRNALVVLAEIGGPGHAERIHACLVHPDIRVRKAAIRAIGRMGGPSADQALVDLLFRSEPDIQIETLYALGELDSRRSAPEILRFIQSGRTREGGAAERVRERAIELLGTLKVPSTVTDLEQFAARRRRFFRETREAMPIRVAALRALCRLDTQEAQHAIDRLISAEPQGPERDAFKRALTEYLQGAHPSA